MIPKMENRFKGAASALPQAFYGICILAIAAASMSCVGGAEQVTSRDDLLDEFYEAQLVTLEALDQAFYEIGREYYVLAIEYDRMGRPELAEYTREKANLFHKQHTGFQGTISELQQKQGRLSRRESPRAVSREVLQQPRTPQVTYTPVPRRATPRPAVRTTPRPAVPRQGQAPAAGQTRGRNLPPVVTPRLTPRPSVQRTPIPRATLTPLPTRTPTPRPQATPIPRPRITPLPTARPTATPAPQVTPRRTAQPTPLPTAPPTPLPTQPPAPTGPPSTP